MDILEEIVAHKRVEIDERKRYVPIQQFIGDVKEADRGGEARFHACGADAFQDRHHRGV